jgi:glycosyltransferase involved in cell wall biosynthesis
MPLPILAWRYNRTLSRKHIIITDLNRHDVVSLYKAADLFLSASHAEYSPLVLFEAAAAGTPFIASDAGNSREIADWTSGGIVYPKVSMECPERSISYLVKNMENLLRNKKRLEIMGKTARNSVLTKGFTWNYITRQYRRLLLD